MDGRIIHGLSNQEYHADHAISRSSLMKLDQSPWHFKHQAADEFRRTDQMLIGELVHCGILEPSELFKRYAEEPKIDKRTKAGREKLESLQEENQGKELIKNDVWTTAMQCISSFEKNETLRPLIPGSHREASIFFEESAFKTKCKSRPDLFKGGLVLDIKTTSDASPRAFQTSCVRYGYFLQAAMTQMALSSIGVIMEKFIIWAIETKFPFATAVYVMDEAAIEYGFNQFSRLIAKLNECRTSNSYPDFGVQSLTVPEWAK